MWRNERQDMNEKNMAKVGMKEQVNSGFNVEVKGRIDEGQRT